MFVLRSPSLKGSGSKEGIRGWVWAGPRRHLLVDFHNSWNVSFTADMPSRTAILRRRRPSSGAMIISSRQATMGRRRQTDQQDERYDSLGEGGVKWVSQAAKIGKILIPPQIDKNLEQAAWESITILGNVA